MLENAKYIGVWEWGKTRTKRNSRGKIRQEPVKPEEMVRVDRPELRIIDQELWNKVQKRRSDMKKIYGYKPGQKRRGAARNWSKEYPTHLLSGVLQCGKCGGRMNLETGSEYRYLGCANHRNGTCDQVIRVPKPKTEAAVLDAVNGYLSREPAWYEAIRASMQEQLDKLNQTLPVELERKEQRLAQLEKQFGNLTDAIATGGLQSDALAGRLTQTEAELNALDAEICADRKRLTTHIDMPPESWIRDQMRNLADVLNDEPQPAALALKRLVGEIRVEEVPIPGKTRGYPRLRLRIAPLCVLRECLQNHDAAAMLADRISNTGKEIVIALGGPTRMDRLAPEIDQMRRQGMSWRAIGKKTGLGRGNAFTAWKRWHDAVTKESELEDQEPEDAA